MEEKIFLEYVSNYDLNDNKIKLKYEHSLRVMELQVKYAKLLNFNEEDIYLAKIIGLLHDIGRFDQIKIYHTFDDSISFDHASYGEELLFKKGLIKDYNIDKKYYNIIAYAIRCHNKLELEPCSNEQMIRHAKLIRDTDKLDILYLLAYLDIHNEKSINESISPKVLDKIKNHLLVDKLDRKNINDHIATKYAFIFDINYDILLPKFKEYYVAYYKKINNDIFKEIYYEVLKYIDERMKK